MFHLIATATVQPSLRSAREHCSKPRPPVMIKTDADPLVCYNHALALGRGGASANTVESVLNGLPIFATTNWTYWLIKSE